MLTRALALMAAVLLASADSGSGAVAAWTQVTDLDAMTEAQLMRDLIDEIDDILDGHDPNEIVDEETVQEVLDALEDQGDDGDEEEIDFADLVAEMSEVNTTVESVVERALEVRVAGGRRSDHTAAANGAAPPRRREAPSRVARALVMAIKSR